MFFLFLLSTSLQLQLAYTSGVVGGVGLVLCYVVFASVVWVAFVECFCVVLLDYVFCVRKEAVGLFDVVSVEKFVVGMVLGKCVSKRFRNFRPRLVLVALEKRGTKYYIFIFIFLCFCCACDVFLDIVYGFWFSVAFC